MNEPIYYEPKTLVPVTAMLNSGTDSDVQAIANWITPLLGESANVIQMSMPSQLSVSIDNEFYLYVPPNAYIYLDEDGFHVAEQWSFEMNYKASSI